MYSIFSNPGRSLVRPMVVPRFVDVERHITSDIDKVVSFYHRGGGLVSSNHLLVRIIQTMGVPLDYSLDRYYEVAKARAPQVSAIFRLTSSVNPGKWFNGAFYFGCNELVLSVDNEDIPVELIKDWRNLAPVKVLEHPVSNLKYMLPNGKEHNIERGLSVISVNIPMLMVMYRGYVTSMLVLRNKIEDITISKRDFVSRFVIPNMLYSQTDIVIFNRLMNLFYGAPMGDSELKHTFYVSDYSEMLDSGLKEVLELITKREMRYRDVLEQIPHVYNDFPLRMPDMAETRQVWWALFITRIRQTGFLFDVCGEEGRHFNRASLNSLKVDIKGLRSENILKKALLPNMFPDYDYEINRLYKGL